MDESYSLPSIWILLVSNWIVAFSFRLKGHCKGSLFDVNNSAECVSVNRSCTSRNTAQQNNSLMSWSISDLLASPKTIHCVINRNCLIKETKTPNITNFINVQSWSTSCSLLRGLFDASLTVKGGFTHNICSSRYLSKEILYTYKSRKLKPPFYSSAAKITSWSYMFIIDL